MKNPAAAREFASDLIKANNTVAKDGPAKEGEGGAAVASTEPGPAQAQTPQGLEAFQAAPKHPDPPFWANPYAKEIDRLIKTIERGADAERATHDAIHAGGDAVETEDRRNHDDARALHLIAFEMHRTHVQNWPKAMAEPALRLAELHFDAAEWHEARGTVFAKPEDFATQASTDAWYLKAYGETHPQARLDTDMILAGTHEIRDAQLKLKVPEALREAQRRESRVLRSWARAKDNPQGNPHSSNAWDLSSEGDHRNAQEAHEIAAGYYKTLIGPLEAKGRGDAAEMIREGVALHDDAAKWHGKQIKAEERTKGDQGLLAATSKGAESRTEDASGMGRIAHEMAAGLHRQAAEASHQAHVSGRRKDHEAARGALGKAQTGPAGEDLGLKRGPIHFHGWVPGKRGE